MKRLGALKIMRSLRGVMMRYVPLMITCRQFEDFIIDYFEGDLPARQKFEFELHIKVCRECREYLSAYKRAVEVTAKATDIEVPDRGLPEAPEDLVIAILAARKAVG